VAAWGVQLVLMSGDAVSSGDICPKRFGLNFDPPSIVLEYLQISTGKLFHRRIGLRRLRATSDPTRVAQKLRQKNSSLLAEDKVSIDQIVTLVKKLQEGLRQAATPSAAAQARLASSPTAAAASPTGGLAAASPAGVSPAGGAVGGAGSLAGSLSPAAASSAAASPAGGGGAGGDAGSTAGGGGSSPAGGAGGVNLETYEIIPPKEEINLNQLSSEDLAQHKAKMDVTFFKNQKKPGDQDYVYDVQVDFPEEGSQPCGWDSESGGELDASGGD